MRIVPGGDFGAGDENTPVSREIGGVDGDGGNRTHARFPASPEDLLQEIECPTCLGAGTITAPVRSRDCPLHGDVLAATDRDITGRLFCAVRDGRGFCGTYLDQAVGS